MKNAFPEENASWDAPMVVNPAEDYFAEYMEWAECMNALIEQEKKARYVPTDDDIAIVDFQD